MTRFERPYAVFIVGERQFTIVLDEQTREVRHESKRVSRSFSTTGLPDEDDSRRSSLLVVNGLVLKDVTREGGR